MGDVVFAAIVVAVAAYGIREIVDYVTQTLGWSDLGHAIVLGVYTMIRVIILMLVATVIWVPISVWVGLRPNWARRVQPAAQFMAAFPANLFFPVFVIAIVHWHLNPDIWLTPLIVLGTQWYIVFNVIAGAAAFPTDLREVAANFRVGGWRWWRRVMIPGIFPYFVTGAITASGGSWNASIVAEVASWGDDKVEAHGIGAYIADATTAGDMAKVILGVAVLSAFVLLFNRGIWRPMYAYAVRRTTLG
jgi:NitT/TauT family transport system permease protein